MKCGALVFQIRILFHIEGRYFCMCFVLISPYQNINKLSFVKITQVEFKNINNINTNFTAESLLSCARINQIRGNKVTEVCTYRYNDFHILLWIYLKLFS